ncbi:hypothetical protein Q31b_17100 [Novipirellula aureliae]|uniref:Uncharacterized protein n=1 Tax=Novipirellula aureliae TaxID=2527966 RepID=A0A5C6E6E7_9BACT|nr:hypothetical protein [Novipirellula aureliae]TWU44174.1 hypothetical protein Q31b_17100 [Novipirellula aureliae]
MMEVNEKQIPDLFSELRRDPEWSLPTRLQIAAWPVIAAAVRLIMSYGLLVYQRNEISQMQTVDRKTQATVVATNIRVSQLDW